MSVGSIKAVAAKSGTIGETVDVASAKVTVEGATVNITLKDDSISGELQDYYLLIDATCFKDSVQSPNFFSGLSQPSPSPIRHQH